MKACREWCISRVTPCAAITGVTHHLTRPLANTGSFKSDVHVSTKAHSAYQMIYVPPESFRKTVFVKIRTKNSLHTLPLRLITSEMERCKAGEILGVSYRGESKVSHGTIVLHLLRSKAAIKRRGEPWRLFQSRGPCWLWLTPPGCRWESAVCVCVCVFIHAYR